MNDATQFFNGAAGSGGGLGIEDVFSTWLYTGNGSTQTITNGIDLAGEGGLVWTKGRSDLSPSTGHNVLVDTNRGIYNILFANTTGAQINQINTVTAFNSNGFDLGNYQPCNQSGSNFASWTFRKAPKFFDVVTWTGDGSTNFGGSRLITHGLGATPGFYIVKRLDDGGSWFCYHRSLGATKAISLNSTDAAITSPNFWFDIEPTSTTFSVNFNFNENGATYVAYLFAHDAGGFGDSGNDSVVSCGSFTTDGSGNATVNLGWEPQFVIAKLSSTTSDWFTFDAMRGFIVQSAGSRVLSPNQSFAEYAQGAPFAPASTGFTIGGGFGVSQTGIYIAIRRGPMKTPTVGAEVFAASTAGGQPATNFPVDTAILGWRPGGVSQSPYWTNRLTELYQLTSSNTTAEVNGAWSPWDSNTNFVAGGGISAGFASYFFRRAPGFFDVVALTGTNSATAYSHNLGVAPEMIIVKKRSGTSDWLVYQAGYPTPTTNQGALNLTGGSYANNNFPTAPTSTQFTLHVFDTGTYIAYLFATCPGVSKVGSYTGTGTTLNIDCGFTAGARFVMIKRTDSTGDWYVWDTARGIISGNDPYLLMNSPNAEVTSTDYIDPLSSGFQISATAPAAINASGGSYIFLAIA